VLNVGTSQSRRVRPAVGAVCPKALRQPLQRDQAGAEGRQRGHAGMPDELL
jgi:hypothetical protein